MPNQLHSTIKYALSPQAAWDNVREKFCDKNIDILFRHNNLRVNDIQGEGVLFKSRNLTRFEQTEGLCASIDRTNLSREIGLSYALFNGRKKKINDYQLISWESPFLRKLTERDVENSDTVSCDLVAYNAKEKTLVAVEVKINPDSEDTHLEHGLFQSMTYGHILHYIFKTAKDGLRKQAKICLERWCEQNCGNTPEINSVGYALAAPLDYFCTSLKLLGQRSKWINEATNLGDARFSGFWVLNNTKITELDSEPNVKNLRCFPHMECDVEICPDVQKLIAYCERFGN